MASVLRAPGLARLVHDDRAWMAGVAVLALVVRAKVVPLLLHDPAFNMPIMDCAEYIGLAGVFFHDGWVGVSNHTLLYPLFLVAPLYLFGGSPLPVVLAQYLLGAASAAATFWIARRLLDRLAAAVAGVLVATYWFFVYCQSWLYAETLSMALNLGLLLWLLGRRESAAKYLIAGVLLGLSVLSRPDVLLFGVTIFWWLGQRGWSRAELGRRGVAWGLGLALVLLPVMTANKIHSGHFLLRSQIGANFYLGNDVSRLGSNIELEIGLDWIEFARFPRLSLGREELLDESELNRFYVAEALRNIARDPGSWMTLILGKTLSLATGREYVRSEDVYFYNRHIRGQLVSLVSTPLIFSLALAGLVLSLRERRRFALLHALVLAAWFTVFFATKTRYIMPFAPIAAIFAGHAVSVLVRGMRARQLRPVATVAVSVAAALAIWALNPLAVPRPDESEALFAIAERHRAYDHPRAAYAFYLKALELDPSNPSIHLDLALLYNRSGNRPAALREIWLARELAPGAPEVERAWYAISGEVPESELR